MRTHLALASFAALALVFAPGCKKSEEKLYAPSASTTKLKAVHRGELSAIATYHQAIEKQGADAAALSQLQRDHDDAAAQLARRISELGGTPDANPGLWGGFAQAVEGTAKVFGNKAAMEILQKGEEHGVREYEEALDDASVDLASKDLIRTTLLPRQRAHIEALKGLIAVESATK